ncbi:MAG: type II toxin-antitoxin system PemK/MazF family toxin [Pseudonocardiaceae bacterium]
MHRYEQLRADPDEWASYRAETHLTDNAAGVACPRLATNTRAQRVSPHAQLAPWQVWRVDFGSPIGPEQGGIRPAIIVDSTTHCRFPIDMALMVPLTVRDRQLDHRVRIASPESGPPWPRPSRCSLSSRRRPGPAPVRR